MLYNRGMKKKPIQPNSDFGDNLGKLLLDMAKLTFASFILGGILKGEVPQNILIAAGCIVFLLWKIGIPFLLLQLMFQWACGVR